MASLQKLVDLLMDPRVAILLFMLFCIAYVVFMDEEGAFSKRFLKFGPGPDANFMGITLDSWSKVVMVYAISFCTALMTGYYGAALSTNFYEKLIDPDLVVPFSRRVVFGIVSVDKAIGLLLEIITIMVITTQQLQFMVPGLFADLLVGVLEASYLLGQKH